MLYEFKSKATGNLVMLQPVAEQILAIIGKSPGKTGIILPEPMPAAIAALREAIAQDRRAVGDTEADAPAERDEERERQPTVSLAQRAWPFIEMLQAAHQANKEITWGV